MNNLPEEDNLHINHRDNLRDTAIQGGLENLEDHNFLELLLFNSIPRRNTNDVSHGMLEEFGDFKGIFSADPNKITKCKNAGETTALFLNALSDAGKRYMQEFAICNIGFDTVTQARDYICEDMKEQNGDVVSLLLLDSSHRVKAKITRSKEEIVTQKIIADAIKNITASRCAFAFVSFTHTNGILAPDKNEIKFVADAKNSFLSLGIMLTDAIIVTPEGNRFLSDTDIFEKDFFVGQIRPNGQPISEPMS